jgi:predicted dehydrogenase
MLKIGIIGCGKIAQIRHIPEYADNKNVKLAAYYDINPSRALDMAGRYGGEVYSSYQQLLAVPDIDAVSVCTANSSHAEISIAALKAGKHVLCEKPMAMSLEECEDMVKTSRQTGKFLMLGHNQRLARAHIKARQLVADGLIGEIITFRTTFGHGGPETWSIDPGQNTWFFDKNKSVIGTLADLGIHKTDLLHYLTGQTVVETTARLATLDKRDAAGSLIRVDDNAFCIYKLSGGAIGTMTASWTYYGAEDNSTVLYGTKGVMRIYDDPAHSITITSRDGKTTHFNTDHIQTNDKQSKSGVIDLFVDCLVNNREPEISGTEALKAMRVIFASIESANTGRTEVIDQSS